MKPREPRLNVMIKARMRAGATWGDALILNMSSKGMLVRSSQPLNRGSYLEIRRGPHVIVARVVWSRSDRCGVQTQDPIPAAALIRDPDGQTAPAKSVQPAAIERRTAARPTALRHEISRQKSRAAQFAVFAVACGFAALFAANIVSEVIAQPLETAQAALAAK